MGIKINFNKANSKIKKELHTDDGYIKGSNYEVYKCCSQCPLKLYTNTRTSVQFGKGNICSGIMIIGKGGESKQGKPPVEEQWLAKCYAHYTKGDNLFDKVYFTYLVKCYAPNHELHTIACEHCRKHLLREIINFNIKKIITIGKDAAEAINKLYPKLDFIPGITVVNLFSPLVIYHDKNKFKEFVKHFRMVMQI